MPFTFAHPAAIIPLRLLRTWRFSSTGLIIGSMVPDFEGFIRMSGIKFYSHTIPGVFWLDTPLGLLSAFLFHLIIRDPLIEHLPLFLKRKAIRYHGFSWNVYFRRHYLVVLYSLLIGIATHLVWDSFTHTQGYFPTVPLGLEMSEERKYDWLWRLQIWSSVAGMVIMLITIWFLKSSEAASNPNAYKYWVIVAFVTCLVTAIRTGTGGTGIDTINTAIGGFLIGLFAASIALKSPPKLPREASSKAPPGGEAS